MGQKPTLNRLTVSNPFPGLGGGGFNLPKPQTLIVEIPHAPLKNNVHALKPSSTGRSTLKSGTRKNP